MLFIVVISVEPINQILLMSNEINSYLNFHKKNGGSGKLFNFKFISYNEGFLKLSGVFPKESLNPNQTVQGGMMTSMLDDVTSLLIIYESKGKVYPSSTNLHSIHHRPLFLGSVIATAEIIKKGKNIATVKGELFNSEGKIATTLIHSAILIKADIK